MRGFGTDLRQALRGLVQAPTVTFVVMATLAVGIGAPTAVFSVVNAVLLRPLPFPKADELVTVATVDTKGRPGAISGGVYLAWREQAGLFADMAAYRNSAFHLRGDEGPERIPGAIVTGSFFEVLGTPPLLGRTLAATDGGRTVVLSERLWRRRFDGARDIVGRPVTLNGETYTVAGVAPASVDFPPSVELWVAARGRVPEHALRPQQEQSTRFDSNYLDAVGRLRPGVTVAQAQAEMLTVGEHILKERPNTLATALVRPLRELLVGNTREPLLIMLAAVCLILLIACVNVSHLLLARAIKRQHEIAVRVALGASRGRLARLFFAESLVLAAAGGLVGTLVALWAAPPLAALGPPGLKTGAISVDSRVLFFALGLALLSAVVFSVLPALTGLASTSALKESSLGATSGFRGRRLRTVLMAIEVALAVVLLTTGGLLVRSFQRVQAVQTGFRPEGVLTADVNLPVAKYGDAAAKIHFLDDVLSRVGQSPEVATAGAVSRLPLSPGNSGRGVSFERNGQREQLGADLRIATPDYLTALGIPLRLGRSFEPTDVAEAPRVLMVNELFAATAWPGENPIGKMINVTLDDKPAAVVGVVGNIKHASLESPVRPEVYVPYAVDPWPFMTIVVRGRVPPNRLVATVRGAVEAVDPDQPLARVSSMEDRIAGSLAPRRFTTLLIGLTAAMALVLSLVGVYGVIAYAVAQRRRELGIRLALGAMPGKLVRAVMAQSLRPVVVGVVVGIAASLGAAHLLTGLLFGVGTTDPVTYVAIVVVAMATASLASLAAARRVTKVSPMAVLRGE